MEQAGTENEPGRGNGGSWTFWASSSKFILSITSWRICSRAAAGRRQQMLRGEGGVAHKEGRRGGTNLHVFRGLLLQVPHHGLPFQRGVVAVEPGVVVDAELKGLLPVLLLPVHGAIGARGCLVADLRWGGRGEG